MLTLSDTMTMEPFGEHVTFRRQYAAHRDAVVEGAGAAEEEDCICELKVGTAEEASELEGTTRAAVVDCNGYLIGCWSHSRAPLQVSPWGVEGLLRGITE